jgi:hypothetical protein
MPTTSNIAQKIWLPGEARPKYECGLCGLMFYSHEERAYGRHMKTCSDQNPDAVLERSTRHKLKDLFAVGDPEREAHTRRNRKAIIEGRMKL